MRAEDGGLDDLPLYLVGDEVQTEFMALQVGHLIPNEAEVKAGLIGEWLDFAVPAGQSKPGIEPDKMSDSDFDEPEVLRTLTCAPEIFEKALGGDLTKYDMRTAKAVGDAMKLLQPEWMPGKDARCGKYGKQRTYRRI
jgi:hypothetical protein